MLENSMVWTRKRVTQKSSSFLSGGLCSLQNRSLLGVNEDFEGLETVYSNKVPFSH